MNASLQRAYPQVHQARFCGHEYVLTQPMDEAMMRAEVETVLREEYQLLCMCDGFKMQFDAHAEDSGVHTIPKFYFNFKDSIFGEMSGSVTESEGRIVPHQHFLATRLLPCGKVDGNVRKFTGSDNIGDASDDITKAIHAFAHFSLLYSHGHILFCDLQGAYDLRGAMCLFDPQAHTNAREREVYWDGGPEKIKAFNEQHAPMCESNWVCSRLGLKDAIVEEADHAESKTPSPSKTIHRGSLDFLVN
ncbi:hypothetical protein AX17_006805 [Amanita inopinata Kibby_2008]|nr:hypothetical protein AX17_006805 [Amanita inopinata Kibby_2008]